MLNLRFQGLNKQTVTGKSVRPRLGIRDAEFHLVSK